MSALFVTLAFGCLDYGFFGGAADPEGGSAFDLETPGIAVSGDSDAPTVDTEDPGCDDADGDGYTDEACGGTDCDDADDTVHPDAEEVCDLVDNDCDGELGDDEIDQDGDGSAVCAGDCDDEEPWLNVNDADGDGVTSCGGDCYDDDDRIFPLDPTRAMVHVDGAADPGVADGSLDTPYAEVQAAVDSSGSETIFCVASGTYEPVTLTSLSGVEILGPADGTAVISGPVSLQNTNDSHLAGVSLNSINSTNSYSDASSRRLHRRAQPNRHRARLLVHRDRCR